MSMRRLAAVLSVLAVLPAAGCGFGAGGSTGDVTLTVTPGSTRPPLSVTVPCNWPV
jgi:hypothetical protein